MIPPLLYIKATVSAEPENDFVSFLNNINLKQPQPVNNKKYMVGMSVKHKKFGTGIIQGIESEGEDFKLDIMFDKTGFKRLMANYTPLEIIK